MWHTEWGKKKPKNLENIWGSRTNYQLPFINAGNLPLHPQAHCLPTRMEEIHSIQTLVSFQFLRLLLSATPRLLCLKQRLFLSQMWLRNVLEFSHQEAYCSGLESLVHHENILYFSTPDKYLFPAYCLKWSLPSHGYFYYSCHQIQQREIYLGGTFHHLQNIKHTFASQRVYWHLK